MQRDASGLFGLRLSVAARQAFGGAYERPADLQTCLDEQRSGLLRLPPHPPWEGNPTDWAADPFGDRNWQFQHHTLRWLNGTRWAALDGDSRASEYWLEIVRSWAQANLPPERAIGPFAWKDMADGNRAIQIALGASLIGPTDNWYMGLLTAHRDWLLDARHVVGGNHGMHQHAGLLVVGALLGDSAALTVAHRRIIEQFETTFDEHGFNDEGSLAYHRLNMQWWGETLQRVRVEGLSVPDNVDKRFAAASNVLAHLTHPNGQMPQIGDSARAGLRLGHGEAADFAASAGTRGKMPDSPVLVLHRGYVSSRSGWGEMRALPAESHMVARHGPLMRAHGHHDMGSMLVYADGRQWLVDPGFHSYQLQHPTREYLHSHAAHNVAVLAGANRDANAPVDLTRHSVSSDAHDFSLLDVGYPDNTVVRRIIYLTGPDCWIVWDSVDSGPSAQLHQHWQVDTGVAVEVVPPGFRLSADQRSLTLAALNPAVETSQHVAIDQSLVGWIGTRWKTLKASARLRFSAKGERSQIVTLIAPTSRQSLRASAYSELRDGGITVELSRENMRWRVTVSAQRTDVERLHTAAPPGSS